MSKIDELLKQVSDDKLREEQDQGARLNFVGKSTAKRLYRKVQSRTSRRLAKYSVSLEEEQARNHVIVPFRSRGGDGASPGAHRVRRMVLSLLLVVITVVSAVSLIARAAAASSGVQSVVLAWGANYSGQLGDGTTGNGSNTADSALPVPVSLPAGVTITAVSAGNGESLALTSAGTVLAWGNFQHFGSTGSSDTPVPVGMPAGVTVTAIANGSSDADGTDLALTSTGQVYAWGMNTYGELGNGTTTNSTVPVPVSLPPGVRVTAIAVGDGNVLALTSTGSLLAWGNYLPGSARPSTPQPVSLPAGVTITAIAAGWTDIFAVTSTGSVFSWGDSTFGEITTPVQVNLPAGVRVTSVSKGMYFTLALTSAGSVFAWGDNSHGQLGNGTTTNSTTPVPVSLPAGVTATSVSAGFDHSLAVTGPSLPTPTPTSTSTLTPTPPTCADAIFIAATGSGQHYKSDTDLSISPQIQRAYNAMLTKLAGRRSVRLQVLKYPALSVDVIGQNLSGKLPQRLHKLLDVNLPTYLGGKNTGLAAMWGAVTYARFSCPNQKIVLAGYSQGAMVVHEFLDQLAGTRDAATKAAIRSVVLIADPERVKHSQTVEFGDAKNNAFGICDYASIYSRTSCTDPFPLTDVPSAFLPVTTDLCFQYDLVCDTSELFHDFYWNTPSGYIETVKLGMFIHSGLYQGSPKTTTVGYRVANLLLASG